LSVASGPALAALPVGAKALRNGRLESGYGLRFLRAGNRETEGQPEILQTGLSAGRLAHRASAAEARRAEIQTEAATVTGRADAGRESVRPAVISGTVANPPNGD